MSKTLRVAFDDIGKELGPIVTVAEFAQLLKARPKTVYHWVQMGRLEGCYRRRGKRLLILRETGLRRIFEGPEWS
jgi:predicted site-specific integrase-resolvase